MLQEKIHPPPPYCGAMWASRMTLKPGTNRSTAISRFFSVMIAFHVLRSAENKYKLIFAPKSAGRAKHAKLFLKKETPTVVAIYVAIK